MNKEPFEKYMDYYFFMFTCCFLTKGFRRSLIIDTQRNNIKLIPNDLYNILELHKQKSLREIIEIYEENNREIILEYFHTLIKEEYGEFRNKMLGFIPINKDIVSSALISNAIIDIRKKVIINFDSAIIQLENLGCKALQIRIYELLDLKDLKNILSSLKSTGINYIEIFINASEKLNFSFCKRVLLTNYSINKIILFNSKINKTYNFNSHQTISQTKVGLTSDKQCGIVSIEHFSTALTNVLESKKFNSCLYKKISIDENGFVKNCPSCTANFGKFGDLPLDKVANMSSFKKLGNIRKETISICKHCEFRHICPDCRVFIQDKTNILSKPSKCNYDPYTTQWL